MSDSTSPAARRRALAARRRELLRRTLAAEGFTPSGDGAGESAGDGPVTGAVGRGRGDDAALPPSSATPARTGEVTDRRISTRLAGDPRDATGMLTWVFDVPGDAETGERIRRAAVAVAAARPRLRTTVGLPATAAAPDATAPDPAAPGVERAVLPATAVVEPRADHPEPTTAAALARHAVDPSSEPPLRVRTLPAPDRPGRADLVISTHHCAADEHTWVLLLDGLGTALAGGTPAASTGVTGEDATPELVDTAARRRAEALRGVPVGPDRPDPFAADRGRADTASRRVELPVDAAWADALRRGAREAGTTPPAVLVDAAARVLARRGAGDVPVVGTPADVRVMLGAGAWDDDGDRVSVIPVAVDTRRPVADGFAAVQEAVRDRCAGLDDVLRVLDLPTSPDRHALVDAVVTHRSGRRTLTLDGGEVTGTYAACGASAFDLVLALEDDGTGAGGAVLSAEARCSAPGPDVARLILAEWRDAVARSVGAEGSAGTGAEGPASPGEVGGTTPTAAAPVTAAPGSGSPVGGAGSAPVDVAAAVARAARDAATAGAVAVSCGGRTLTYAQLDRAVDATVGVLRDAGARPGDVVALRLHRGAGVPVAMLAALRAGTPFVAVDPGQPAGRAAAVLAAADPRAGIDDATVEAVLDGVRDAASGGATDGSADTVAAAPAAAGTPAPGSAASSPSDGATHPDSPAYLVFTSGTTGTPKGVTVPRRGLDAVLGAAVDMLCHGPGVTSLAGSTLGFDISVVEMLGALAAGGRVHVAPATFASDPAAAVAELRAVRPHIVEATPSLWSEILACDPTVVRGVLACAGGEALPAATATGLRAAGADVLNLYGPSETSVIATAHRVTGDGTPPLGAVLPGLRAEVLDARLRPVPDGAVGELYLSGPQVALGYLGAPGTTAAAFVAGPGGRRRYRTGDLVSRRVPDGAVRFHGRADDQLSLRGLRIELAEVEAALTAAPAVAAAAVRVAGGPGREVLLGYVVTTDTAADPVPGIRAALTATLPSGARPARITVLDHLPRNANGKVDRAALPVPADLGADTGAGPDAVGGGHPTPTERTVTAAVRDVLGLADTPPTGADVRSLGGHSLLAHRLALRLSADLGVTVPAREVLADGTLADLARTCDDLIAAGGPGTPATGDAAAGPGPTGGVAASSPDHPDTPGPVDPLPGQRRIVTAEALDDTPGLYTLPVIVECDTAPAPAVLGRALQEVCRRHPVLRTRPRLDGGRVVSTLLAAADVPAPPVTALTTTRELTPVVLRDLLATPFTAADGPVRAAVVTRRDAPPVVALLLHHAWADEWSLGPFFADLAAALGAEGRHDGDAGDPGHGSTAGRPEGPSYAAVRDALGAGSAQDRAFWAGRRHALAPAETPLPFSRSSRPDGAARGAGDAPTGAGAGGTTGAGGDVHLTATVPAPGLARGDAATVVRAAVLLLLDRAGAEPVVGVPVAGRHDARLLDVVGYLGNTLPVTVGDPGRGVLAPGAPVRGVVDAVRAEVTDVALRSSVPLEELTDGGVPFRVLVDHRVGDVPVPDVPGWNARPVDPPTVPAKFPLTVMVTEPGADPVAAGHDDSGARDDAADMRLDLLFSGAEFDADGARSFAAALRRVVRTVARAVTATAGDDRAPGRREPCVADVALGTVPATVTTPEGTGRAATLARRHGVAAAVDDALRRCRDLPVLTGRGETLTGGQVLAATAAVADAVTDAVGGPDGTTGTVAVHLGARRDEVLALLGVLRTGRPFTVLRQDDPPGRLSAALADAQVTAVLTDRPGLLTGAVAEGVVVVPLPGLPGTGTDPAPGTTRDLGAVPVPARPADGDPAYVCFTSGTTGRPKGVMVGHGALAGLLDVSDAVFAPDGDAALARGVRPRFVSVAPMHFDVGVLEVLATLTTGGHLLVADDADRVGTALVRTVTRHRATHMSVTPTVLAGLGDPAGIGEDVVVFSGAEPLPVDLALAWADRHRLINLYGPTEATVNALHGDVDPATVRRTGTVPVGEADPGTAALVLDAALRPVPDGMPGELWLAGTGLALGYPASPGLTAARFTAVPDEWGLAPGARMYRTGDLAVRAADGTVTCTGRIDDQFKIRGLRVEPGDIEAAFRADGRVAAAVAVPVAGRRDTLAAGVVPAAGTFTDADLEELRRGVARVLPRYLVPQRVVAVAALPVTPNGKTDRRQAARDVAAALEAGGGVAGTAAAATVATGGAAPAAAAPVDGAAAPDDPALAALVTALTAVLDPGSGVPTAEDSVLGLGGDSIGALEIVARLRDAGWTVAPRDVLDAPTLAALAATMRRTGGGADGSDGPDDGAARAAADADATATAPGAPGDAADAAGIAPTGRFTPGRVAGEFVAESPEALLTQTMLLAVPSSAVGRVAGMVERLVDLHPALRTRTVTGAGGVDPVVDRTTDPTGPTTGPTGPTDPTTDPTDPTPVPLCETLPAGTPGTLHVHPPVTATGPDAADTIADLRRELDAALDVTAGRLTAVAEVETDAGPAVALTVHHLAVDAASWSRLIADLRALAGGRDPGPAGTSPRAGAVRTGAAGPSPEVPGRSGEGADAALTPPTARIASGPVGPGDTAATAERDVLTVPAAVAGALVARHGTGADLGRAVEEAVVAAVRAVDPWGPAAVAVDVEGHGRGDGVDPRAVGWWTRVTTRRHVAAGASAGGAGAGVDGADAATVVETVAERPVPRDRRADVLLNHLGTTGTVADPGAFTPLALPGVPPVDAGVGPDTPLRSALTVTSSVTPAADGPVLSLTLVRATRLVPAATAAAFRGHVLAALADGVGLGGGSAGLTVLPVTPTQEGLVLIDDAADPGAAAYVVRMAFTVSGLRDARALARAWRRLGDRHPALAATFHRGRDGRVRAVSGPGTAPSAEIVDGPVAAGDPAATPFDAPFDLARGPLARLRVTPGSDGRHRVEVALHHVIADGWSAPVIMRDLFALLAADARPADPAATDPAATDPAATDPAARVDPVPALAAVTARRHPDRRWRRLLRDARPTALAPGGTDDGTRADTVVTL
ncbi:AMP-binding protein, partial [Corynebacterium bovis]